MNMDLVVRLCSCGWGEVDVGVVCGVVRVVFM